MSASMRTRAPTSAPAGSTRRHELDWLRMAAVFGLIPFHVAVIFTTGSYDYVKNAQTSRVMDLLVSFISIWGISLLFLVAGAASRYALAVRGTARFLQERVMRLLVPLAFGMLLIVPTQVYIGRVASGAPPPVLAFYSDFLRGLVGILQGRLPPSQDWIGHLWFIPPLMLFSLLAPPFSRLLQTRHVTQAASWLADGLHGYAPLALFGLPLAVAQFAAFRSDSLIANVVGVVGYLLFFLYGYLLYLKEGFLTSVRRDAWKALVLGAATWLALTFVLPGLPGWMDTGSASLALRALLRGYCAWWWVMGVMGMAIGYLRFTTPVVEYLTRAAYPVYIIHMPILSLVALWVAPLSISIALKFGVIVVASLLLSLAVYALLIRRIGALRLLFGLGARDASQPPADGSQRRKARRPPHGDRRSPTLRHSVGQRSVTQIVV